MEKKNKTLIRFGMRLLFYLYIVVIFYFVLVSERYGRETGYQTSHMNLELFKEIRRFWTYRSKLSVEAVITNLFGNVFAFSPFGFFLPSMTAKKRGLFRVIFFTFCFSLAIETTQLVLKVGVFDVDDLLLNTLGGFIGYIVYLIILAFLHQKDKKKR